MSIYPTYALEALDPVQDRWVPMDAYEASNRPHHYDYLRNGFEELVADARIAYADGPQGPIGYRITSNGHPVDVWTNEKEV